MPLCVCWGIVGFLCIGECVLGMSRFLGRDEIELGRILCLARYVWCIGGTCIGLLGGCVCVVSYLGWCARSA